MYYLIVFKLFVKILGRVGYVSVKRLQDEMNCSRSTANRYMKAMVKSGLVQRYAHGKYYIAYDRDFFDGMIDAITPIDFYIRKKPTSVLAEMEVNREQ